ncbi:MAG: hypothetical protein ABR880_05120 [Candidatus Sulfotelmatobacter sp.]|jgi:hypothetical protein
MSHTNRNFILAYTFLVALPVLGLVGILKSGRSLTAPISVDGMWQLQADAVRLAALPCGKTLAENPDTALVISQSGKNFTLSLSNDPKSTGSGELDGTTLRASLAPSAAWSDDAGCGTGRELSLVAKVDPKADPRSLVGVLSVNHCPECRAVEFQAVRQSPPVRKGPH